MPPVRPVVCLVGVGRGGGARVTLRRPRSQSSLDIHSTTSTPSFRAPDVISFTRAPCKKSPTSECASAGTYSRFACLLTVAVRPVDHASARLGRSIWFHGADCRWMANSSFLFLPEVAQFCFLSYSTYPILSTANLRLVRSLYISPPSVATSTYHPFHLVTPSTIGNKNKNALITPLHVFTQFPF